MVTALWAVLLSFCIMLMQFSLLYYYKDSLTHVPVLCTIYYNIQALRNSKLSLLSAGGISNWERDQLCDLFVSPQGRFVAYSLLPADIYAGEVSLLSTWTVMDFNSDNTHESHQGSTPGWSCEVQQAQVEQGPKCSCCTKVDCRGF